MKELIESLTVLISRVKNSSLSFFIKILFSVFIGSLIGVSVLLTSCTFKAADLEFCVYNPKAPLCQQS